MNSIANTTCGTNIFPSNCESNLELLAKSPTFAMSLGAKELFHTNFLAFLLESTEPSVVNIQKKLKTLLFGHCKVGRVITWREKHSLDLVIMPAPVQPKVISGEADSDSAMSIGAELEYNSTCEECTHSDKKCKCPIDYCDTIAVVIEAKLKSIPTQQQLDGYDVKLINGIDFELDDIDTVNVSDVSDGKDTRTWQAMRLKLIANGDMKNCNSECSIEARGKNINGKQTREIKKFKGTVRRILLRPMTKEPTGGDAQPSKIGCWEQMSWEGVVNALECDRLKNHCEIPSETNQLRQCKETELLPHIICDYRDSLEQLLAILNQTEDYVNLSIGALTGNTLGKYNEAITHQKFKARRIHDLVGKYASHILERHVLEFLVLKLTNTGRNEINCEDCSSANISIAGTTLEAPTFKICDNIEFELNTYTHFSNSQPGVAFEWLLTQQDGDEKKNKTISFGIQIQGHQYRHFIEAKGGNIPQRKAVLDSLENTLGNQPTNWFLDDKFFNPISKPNFTVKKQNPTTQQINKFYVFGENSFRYSKAVISSLPLTELAQAVFHSLCTARQIFLQSGDKNICASITEFLKVPDDSAHKLR